MSRRHPAPVVSVRVQRHCHHYHHHHRLLCIALIQTAEQTYPADSNDMTSIQLRMSKIQKDNSCTACFQKNNMG